MVILVKFEAIKGTVMKVEKDEIVMRAPEKIDLGGSKKFVCRLNRVRRDREIVPGDQVMAFNVYKTLRAWRARRAVLL